MEDIMVVGKIILKIKEIWYKGFIWAALLMDSFDCCQKTVQK
jgi:hypothetical protein